MSVSGSQPWVEGPIKTVDELEERLSRPAPEVVDLMGRLEGDLIVLGVGGKIGPSLARMARRASDEAGRRRRVIGVSRFSRPGLQEQLEAQGIETIRCDLLDRSALEALPDVPLVLYLAAMKFGATGNEPLTWAMNTYLPGMVAERYRNSRIVAYSTGNVYAMAPVTSNGSVETDPPCPVGDYAMSCLGRERIFSYFSQRFEIPTALVRLNYANELRYGVLTDLAQKVLAEQPIDLNMGYFNVIWQGDSNAMTLRALEHVAVPPWVVNMTGPDKLRVRDVAEQFGRLLDKPVRFHGTEAPDALLSDARRGYAKLGRPQVSVEQMIRWVAYWQQQGGPTLGKPTHFETRDGKF
ncbi:MAG TPA: NAD(P)-dependent oxidoreductase [Planctomycetaceae bacterium]|nr:NAD(P)-dependent oxidoreductase [Planctomycetaceae bacterium]HIQ20522.1 NAD(P)-dependent oxidoreductase [Planctomycetota bacterium]